MQDLTTGSVTRHLLKTTGFMLVTMLFQTLYFLVDLYWVGRLGKEAVAAVSVAGNLFFVVLAVSQMLAVGTTVLVSHAVGRKDRERALLIFNQAQVLSALVGTLFLVLSMAFRDLYTTSMSADATTARLASEYLAWFLPGSALQFAMVAMSAGLRGTGNFKPGMVVQTGTVILNMIVAPFLMFGWLGGRPMGIAGAGLATFVAIVVGVLWLLVWFRGEGSYLKFAPRDWRPRLDLWRAMLGIGLPAGAEFVLMAIYLVIVYAVSRPFGAAAQAGFGIGLRIIQALFMPAVALGFSVAPVAGQNFGARHFDRVTETFRSAVVMSTVAMTAFALLCHVAPAAMVRVFSQDPEVVGVGDEYLRIVSWNFIASGVIFVASSMFQALGNSWPALLSSFVRITAIAVPTLLLARVQGFRLVWIWYMAVASVLLQMVLSLWLLRRELRLKMAMVSSAAPASGSMRSEGPA